MYPVLASFCNKITNYVSQWLERGVYVSFDILVILAIDLLSIAIRENTNIRLSTGPYFSLLFSFDPYFALLFSEIALLSLLFHFEMK
jgi:hypothetical protein